MIDLRALDLLLENSFESDRIGCELRDTFPELEHGHFLLVEVESECRLIVKVRLLRNVQALRIFSLQLLGDLLGRVVEVLEVVGLWPIISYMHFSSFAKSTYRDS